MNLFKVVRQDKVLHCVEGDEIEGAYCDWIAVTVPLSFWMRDVGYQ